MAERELMGPFRFELAAIEAIGPWGPPGAPQLSWFALSLGDFWIDLGRDELFRYTPAALAAWGARTPYADYQVASFVRDLRACVGPALVPLPAELARVAADVARLAELRASTQRVADELDTDEAAELAYAAWRWLGERSPWMSYLVEHPRFHFVRLGDDIQLGYDNRACLLDGVPVWTAQLGQHRMSAAAFSAAITEVSVALLEAMAARIDELEHGRATAQAPFNVAALREQHASWSRELACPLGPSPPDVPWDETLAALRALGAKL